MKPDGTNVIPNEPLLHEAVSHDEHAHMRIFTYGTVALREVSSHCNSTVLEALEGTLVWR
jgi:hypothetical protein